MIFEIINLKYLVLILYLVLNNSSISNQNYFSDLFNNIENPLINKFSFKNKPDRYKLKNYIKNSNKKSNKDNKNASFPQINESKISSSINKICSTYDHYSNTVTLSPNCDEYLTKSIFQSTIKEIGWNKLYQYNKGTYPFVESYAMGYAEGRMSYLFVYEMRRGMLDMMSGSISASLTNKLSSIKDKLYGIMDTDNFDEYQDKFESIKFFAYYLKGMQDGVNKSKNSSDSKYNLYFNDEDLKYEDLLYLNENGEINELEVAVQRYRFKMRKPRGDMTKWQKWLIDNIRDENRFYRFKSNSKTSSKNYYWNYNYYLNPPKDLNSSYEKIDFQKLMINSPNEYEYIRSKESHCSAVVKLTKQADKVEDVFLGHSTFDDFKEMVRIYKYYDIKVRDNRRTVSFSSYAGILYSTDDFYILSNKLAITQTTIGPADASVYKQYKNNVSIPSFLRLMMANVISDNINSWIDNYKFMSSHTNSAQYILIDYNLVNNSIKQRHLVKESVVILENLGDSYLTIDISELLNKIGYFGSFNYSYFTNVLQPSSEYTSIHSKKYYDLSLEEIEHYKNYNHNSRFNVMKYLSKRDHDFENFKKLLRYNNNFKDRDSGEPYGAVCVLSADFGCTDSKVVNLGMVNAIKVETVSGPTYGDDLGITPFVGSWFHEFMPQTWNFNWVVLDKESFEI